MDKQNQTWQERFGLSLCPAAELATVLPEPALGIAVLFAPGADGKVFLVIESRASSLLQNCLRRFKTAPLPPLETLQVAFMMEEATDGSLEAVHEVCRRQVVMAGALRRELRPALR